MVTQRALKDADMAMGSDTHHASTRCRTFTFHRLDHVHWSGLSLSPGQAWLAFSLGLIGPRAFLVPSCSLERTLYPGAGEDGQKLVPQQPSMLSQTKLHPARSSLFALCPLLDSLKTPRGPRN